MNSMTYLAGYIFSGVCHNKVNLIVENKTGFCFHFGSLPPTAALQGVKNSPVQDRQKSTTPVQSHPIHICSALGCSV